MLYAKMRSVTRTLFLIVPIGIFTTITAYLYFPANHPIFCGVSMALSFIDCPAVKKFRERGLRFEKKNKQRSNK